MNEAELAFAGVARQAEMVRSKDVSVRELIEMTVKRIERLDRELNAFRSVYPERAIEEAKSAQRKLRSKQPPPLLGVPVAIKDNFDVAGDVTTHGTSGHGGPAQQDCEVVRRVREAGAIVVGKTHLPELAAMNTTESASFGWSRNPWDTGRSTGGSSGGSAAAVAAGMVPTALASDGGGSIRIPAAFCGVFGLKPQRGRISLAPLAEHWHGLSVAGWETRSVADSALMLDATAGATEVDAEAAPPPDRPFAEAAAATPEGLRIAYSFAVPAGFLGIRIEDEVRSGLLQTVEVLRSLGHRVEEQAPKYGFAAASWVPRFLKGAAQDAAALPHPERLQRRTRGWVRSGRLLPSSVLEWARRQEAPIRDRVNGIFERFDVLITPVTSCAAFELGRWEGRGSTWTLNGMSSTVPWPNVWNLTGQPAASVPSGLSSSGLPLAVQLVGRPNDEATLLSLAAQLEGEVGWTDWRPPVS